MVSAISNVTIFHFWKIRFIRYDANEALDAFSEHCSIAKVIGGLAKWGVHHKNVVARTACGRLLADISRELG